MKSSHLRFFAHLLAVSFFAACSSSTMSRIDSNRAVYETWPIDMKEAVLNGQVKPGMTPEMVEMAVGKPSQVVNRSGKGGDDEVWVYKKGGAGGSILNNTGVSLGGGIGGVNVGGGRRGQQRPTNADEQEVVFRNGVVTRSDVTP